MLTYDQACRISDHLLTTGQGFCFLPDGSMVTKEDCEKVIDAFNTLPLKRVCLRCGDELQTNDDLICGYHNLEN